MLKDERHARILDLLRSEGRVVASELPERIGVSGHTIRRDLAELSESGQLQRVHGGAVARSQVGTTYARRQRQELPGKLAVAQAAATLLTPDAIAIVDGGTTALQLVEALPADQHGTVVTHSPLVAAALARERPGVEVVLIGGTLDARAMVAVGAETIRSYEAITADVCFLGVWSVDPLAGITSRYREEAEVRRVMVQRADRVVGLASRDKLNTVAAFQSAPATALTHLATEPDVPDDQLAPFRELGIEIVRADQT